MERNRKVTLKIEYKQNLHHMFVNNNADLQKFELDPTYKRGIKLFCI